MSIEIEDEATFHCGHCGQPVDSGGTHLDEAVTAHAEPMAVADEWPTEDIRPNDEDETDGE